MLSQQKESSQQDFVEVTSITEDNIKRLNYLMPRNFKFVSKSQDLSINQQKKTVLPRRQNKTIVFSQSNKKDNSVLMVDQNQSHLFERKLTYNDVEVFNLVMKDCKQFLNFKQIIEDFNSLFELSILLGQKQVQYCSFSQTQSQQLNLTSTLELYQTVIVNFGVEIQKEKIVLLDMRQKANRKYRVLSLKFYRFINGFQKWCLHSTKQQIDTHLSSYHKKINEFMRDLRKIINQEQLKIKMFIVNAYEVFGQLQSQCKQIERTSNYAIHILTKNQQQQLKSQDELKSFKAIRQAALQLKIYLKQMIDKVITKCERNFCDRIEQMELSWIFYIQTIKKKNYA